MEDSIYIYRKKFKKFNIDGICNFFFELTFFFFKISIFFFLFFLSKKIASEKNKEYLSFNKLKIQ